MNTWVNRITAAVIALLLMVGAGLYALDYQWLIGTIELPNRELALADTQIEVVFKDLVTQREYGEMHMLRKGKNIVNYTLLVPETKNQFTISYRLDKEKAYSVMGYAYNEGALDDQLQSVSLDQAQPLTLDRVKNRLLRIQLIENKPAREEADAIVASLLDISQKDALNAKRFIQYIHAQQLEQPQVRLRWLLTQADLESELFQMVFEDQSKTQLMNALLIEGTYYYVDFASDKPELIDRSALNHKYPYAKLEFEHGIDR